MCYLKLPYPPQVCTKVTLTSRVTGNPRNIYEQNLHDLFKLNQTHSWIPSVPVSLMVLPDAELRGYSVLMFSLLAHVALHDYPLPYCDRHSKVTN